jgi:replication factor C subunit 1
MKDLWVEKHRPTKIDDIVGQTSNIDTAEKWLEAYQNKDETIKRSLLLSGPPGLGKTTLAHCLLTQYGYEVHEYNASDVRTQKLVDSELNELIKTGKITKLFKSKNKPVAIIMDEVDGMMAGDSGGFKTLIKFINPNRGTRVKKDTPAPSWKPPIICICNNLDKKLKDLRKDCLEIKFTNPKKDELVKLIDKITKSEGFKVSKDAYDLIIEVAQNDYRRLIHFLQYLYQAYCGCEHDYLIKKIDVMNSREIFSMKEKDTDMSDNVSLLLNKRSDTNKIMNIYRKDKSLIPMMVHENYINCINSQDIDAFDKLELVSKTIDSIVAGDVIDKTMYNNQSWHLQKIHGVYSTLIPHYLMNKTPKKSFVRYNFTTALSRFSIACTNRKTLIMLKNLMSNNGSYSNKQIHHFSRIVCHLLTTDGVDKAVKLLLNYNLSVAKKDSELDKLLRINMFRDYKEMPIRIRNSAYNTFVHYRGKSEEKNKIKGFDLSKVQQNKKEIDPIEKYCKEELEKTAVTMDKVPKFVIDYLDIREIKHNYDSDTPDEVFEIIWKVKYDPFYGRKVTDYDKIYKMLQRNHSNDDLEIIQNS